MSDTFLGLIGALHGIPRLPGAVCRGRWNLFDEAEPGEPEDAVAARYTAALALCQRCPAIAACEAYFLSLPPAKKPGGVIAGRVHRWQTTTRRRKESA